MARFNDGAAMTSVVQFTRTYLDSILAEERLIDAVEPDLSMDLWGEKFASPIMTPAFSHLKTFASERENGMCEYSSAAAQMNQVNWVGMMKNEEYAEIAETGARTIRIIKPYADHDEIYSRIEFAESHDAFAVGMDIDHIFGDNGRYDICVGEQMANKSMEDIKKFVEFTKLPYVIKGVLSVQDALKCADAGVSGIVVSHHHGRMPFAMPPLMVLPEILKALGPDRQMRVFVDCGIDSGYDAFKALALGADAVSAGRVLFKGLIGGGTEGVKAQLEEMNTQLRQMMAYTGCSDLSKMDASILHIPSCY